MGSASGTNVKIFTTSDCVQIKKLQRGATYSRLCQLSFSQSSGLLSLTSVDKQTVHVWRCGLESLALSQQQ